MLHISTTRTKKLISHRQQSPMRVETYIWVDAALCPEGVVCDTAVTTSVPCSLRHDASLTPWFQWTRAYGLDNRAIGVRSPAGAKDFSSNLCVQTGSGAHPASCTMGTGVLSPGVKRGRGVMLTTHPLLVPMSWMSRSYTFSPPKRLHGV
jgi:hypothetical protein